jgi:hypothetical protein
MGGRAGAAAQHRRRGGAHRALGLLHRADRSGSLRVRLLEAARPERAPRRRAGVVGRPGG